MKKSLIAVLALGLFAAMAQAQFLTNPVPLGSDPTNSLAALEQGGAQVNGGLFTTGPSGLQISDFEAWLVDQGDGTVTQSGSGPSQPAGAGGPSLGLLLADLGPGAVNAGSATWQDTGWSVAYTPFQYSDGTNYYSTTFSAGNYLPMYAMEWSAGDGSSINLTGGDMYAWAVTGLNGVGVAGALLLDSQSACLGGPYGSPDLCNPGGYGNALDWTGVEAGLGLAGGYVTVNGANVDTNFGLTPEPGTWLLIAAGAGVLAIARRRKI